MKLENINNNVVVNQKPDSPAARTELVFIVDRSGSMYGLEEDTVGGINAVLEANRKLSGEVTVSTVLFNTETQVLNDREDIKAVVPLTRDDYVPGGCTALLDAVGGGIRHVEKVQKYMPDGHKADKVIFVITTDGLENASRKYSYRDVKKAISAKTEQGWEFLFLGANIDAAAEAGRLGIAEDRACEYVADSLGSKAMYNAVADATCCMRSAPKAARPDGSWREKIFKDRASRGK
ncbi:MAG: VWA domain-containing protein [Coriobacteriia bacterium]|nr:VWA domain-containing protein [Coriobacteriia bacterium]